MLAREVDELSKLEQNVTNRSGSCACNFEMPKKSTLFGILEHLADSVTEESGGVSERHRASERGEIAKHL